MQIVKVFRKQAIEIVKANKTQTIEKKRTEATQSINIYLKKVVQKSIQRAVKEGEDVSEQINEVPVNLVASDHFNTSIIVSNDNLRTTKS